MVVKALDLQCMTTLMHESNGTQYRPLLVLGLARPPLSRSEVLTPIGAVEVLVAFDLAAGPHV